MTYTATEGMTLRLTANFSYDGQAVDPTTVECDVRDPAGALTTPVVTKGASGEYTAIVTVDAPGLWAFRFEAVGAYPQVNYGVFRVRPAPF